MARSQPLGTLMALNTYFLYHLLTVSGGVLYNLFVIILLLLYLCFCLGSSLWVEVGRVQLERGDVMYLSPLILIF